MNAHATWSARRRFSAAAALVVLYVLTAIPSAAGQAAGGVLVTDVSGAVGVATARQITRAIEHAAAAKAQALIIRLDTPGGLVSSTREIIKVMVAAPVPVSAQSSDPRIAPRAEARFDIPVPFDAAVRRPTPRGTPASGTGSRRARW